MITIADTVLEENKKFAGICVGSKKINGNFENLEQGTNDDQRKN